MNIGAFVFCGLVTYSFLYPVNFIFLSVEGSHSGLVRHLGKVVYRKVPWVRIPHPPPSTGDLLLRAAAV